MDFVDSFVNAPSAKSRTKSNRWLDPNADPIGLNAVIQSGILKDEALAKAQKEEKDAALLGQVEAGLITPTLTTDTTDDTTSTATTDDNTDDTTDDTTDETTGDTTDENTPTPTNRTKQ